MIKLDTTFVVGAGASVDYNFPLGEVLTKQISEALNFNRAGNRACELIRSAIDVIGQRPDAAYTSRQMFEQAHAMRAALATSSSIDAFLENHSDTPCFETLGKFAIAACLATAENQSALKSPRGELLDVTRVENSWLGRLFKTVMVPGISKASVERIFAHVSFVVFNYDRCIEHFFEHAIARHFLMDLPAASTIVRKHLRVVHPYGDLGPLHGSSVKMAFGEKHDPSTHAAVDAIDAMSKRILTFTESKKAQGAAAQAEVGKAKRLVFLGFGFGEQNVDLLKAPTANVEHVRATVMGMSKSNQSEVLYRIAQITGREVGFSHLHECDCAKLIDNEQMFLTRNS